MVSAETPAAAAIWATVVIGVPALGEQLEPGVEDALPGLLGLRLPQRRAIWTFDDSVVHFIPVWFR